jgi:hypothetical protein
VGEFLTNAPLPNKMCRNILLLLEICKIIFLVHPKLNGVAEDHHLNGVAEDHYLNGVGVYIHWYLIILICLQRFQTLIAELPCSMH